jgi:alpha-1,3-glucosyltransferase
MGGALFATLLNFKHIYLYLSLPYFIYLLRSYCWEKNPKNFLKLAGSIILIFLLSFGPFLIDESGLRIDIFTQILSRLFPFKRGLCHSYWAPNFWALYSFLDRSLLQILKLIGISHLNINSLTRGIVGDNEFAILPNVSPLITFLLTFMIQIPSLIKLWKSPTFKQFLHSLIISGFCSFFFGWHVHEKAILMIILPLGLLVTFESDYIYIWNVLNWVGYYSLFPLLFRTEEHLIKISIFLLYCLNAFKVMWEYHEKKGESKPTFIQLGLISGIGLLHIMRLLVIYILPNHEFLPLMMISTYCSIGVFYVFVQMYKNPIKIKKR